jgi:8-oxo-dGTP pyrophosphatase MutT (NUDIX family)
MEETDTNKVSKILILSGGKVLLLMSDRLNKYHLAGGHIKENETFTTGLIREVKEETGLTVSSCKIVEKTPKFCLFKGHVYAGHITLSEEHSSYVWAKIEDLHKYPLCKFTKESVKHLHRELKNIKDKKKQVDIEE